MDLFRERSAFTGAETFADGVFTSMFVIVEHFTCIIWEGHQAVRSVIAETAGTMCAGLPTLVKMAQPVNRMVMVKRVSAHPTSKENTVTKMLTNVPPILVRMEPSVPTLTETTSVLVTADLLERTVIKM